MSTFRPLILGGLLLAMPWVAAPAKNVKPDPNGLAPHVVQDLSYGDVLFYFYQDDYFDAITRLLAARQLGRIPHTLEESELLLGGLYLSLGEHVEAGRIFEALLAGKVSEAVRNKAWFYLGKVWYQRGYLDESERALRQVSDKIQPRISAERYMLLAQLKLREGRYDDAIAALQSWHGAPDWTAYAQFNLGARWCARTGCRRRSPISIASAGSRPATRNCSAYATRRISPSDSRTCRRNGRRTRNLSSSACGWRDRSRAWRCSASAGPIPRRASSSARWCRGSRCASATCSTPPCRSPISPSPTRTTSWARRDRPRSTTAPRS